MTEAMGEDFGRHWANTHVISALGGQTPAEALQAGDAPKQVWAVVCRTLELPESLR